MPERFLGRQIDVKVMVSDANIKRTMNIYAYHYMTEC